MNLKEFMELNGKEDGQIMTIDQFIVLSIIRRLPFLFKDYLILDHEDPKIDFGLKRFWLHINQEDLNSYTSYKVTPDEQHFEGWKTYYQQHILIGKLQNVWTGKITDDWSYSEYFRQIFDKYKNAEEFNLTQEIKDIKWKMQEREKEIKELLEKVEPGMRQNPPKKII